MITTSNMLELNTKHCEAKRLQTKFNREDKTPQIITIRTDKKRKLVYKITKNDISVMLITPENKNGIPLYGEHLNIVKAALSEDYDMCFMIDLALALTCISS